MNEYDIFRTALNKWGKEAQVQMCIEECGELIVALSKLQRKVNGSTTDEVIEELADVDIMISQMKILFAKEKVDAFREKKMAKLEMMVSQ